LICLPTETPRQASKLEMNKVKPNVLDAEANCLAQLLSSRSDSCGYLKAKVMGGFQEISSTLTDYDTWRHLIASRNAGQNRSIGDPQVVYAIHSEIAVDDRHGIPAHFLLYRSGASR